MTFDFVMFVRRSAWNNSAATGKIFISFDTLLLFENLPRKFRFHSNLTRLTGNVYEDQYSFLTICRSAYLRMRTFRWMQLRMKNVSDRSCREKTQILGSISYFFSDIVPFMT